MKQLLLILLLIPLFGYPQCEAPMFGQISNTQGSGENYSFDFSWTPVGTETAWQVLAQYDHFPMPGPNVSGFATTTPTYNFSNLPCGNYRFFVRAICNGTPGPWGELNVSVGICGLGVPPDVEMCDEYQDGTEYLDLTLYNDYFLSYMPESIYEVAYYSNEVDAQNQANELEPQTLVINQDIYVRFDDVNPPNDHYIWQYAVVLHLGPQITGNFTAEACHDGSGNAVFNLNYITNQIFAAYPETAQNWTLTYYPDDMSADIGINEIQNTGAFTPVSPYWPEVIVRAVDNVTGCISFYVVGLQYNLCNGFELHAFFDADADGIRDANEVNFPHGTFSYAVNGSAPVNAQSSSGLLNIADDDPANQYQISFVPNSSNFVSTPGQVVLNAGPNIQEVPFAVTATQIINDLSAALVPYGSPRPGFNFANKIAIANAGTTIQSGTLTFAHDATVSIVSMPTGAASTASGFTLAFSNLMPFETREFTVMMNVPTIPTVSLGQMLTNSVSITVPANDIVPANNTYSLTQTIVGSYDPNDKVEAHGGPIVLEQFSPDEELVYTIRFENTGTAAASFITVEDELDAQLDAGSLRMISASHDYVLTKNGQNLSWFFDDVNLPPTVQDPIGSHGYITFAVKPHSGLQVGDIIPNSAAIFFDFNPAIITNTFETEFMAPLSTPGFNDLTFTIHPNPASETVQINASGMVKWVTVTDMTGKIVMESVPSEQNPDVNIAKLQSGLYLMQVTLEDGTRSMQKLIKK